MRRFLYSFLLMVLCALPAQAALPYYNADLGYTIWLAEGWTEVPNADLSRFDGFRDGVSAYMTGWEAGYVMAGETQAELLVSELHGRVISKQGIANFNRFVVRELEKASRKAGREGCARLRSARFDSQRNFLRLEMDSTMCGGEAVTSVVYIVYTSTGMLKFSGLASQGDTGAVRAIDAAVATLYLDYGLRQECEPKGVSLARSF